MKKIICAMLACLMPLGLCACGGNGAAGATEPAQDLGLQVGFGRTNITPGGSVCLQGGNYANRWSTGVLDVLYATCIALKSGD